MSHHSSTIKLEGALFTRDFLMRLGAPQSDLEQLTPASYGLAGGRLREAIGASWNTLVSRYNHFQEQLEKIPDTDPAIGLTRREWILPLLEELRFGRVQPAEQIQVTLDTVDGEKTKTYPISHGWNHVPLHLLGWNVPLDKRTPGVPGAAQTSPHALIQEALNRSDNHLWAILCNGQKLRLLRDSAAIARQSYIEFDLETMFKHEHASDFALLWMLCHASRFEGREIANGEDNEILSPHLLTSLTPGAAKGELIIETWLKNAEVDGQRALDKLRDGVQSAIEAVATGFLKHPENRALREKLREGELPSLDFYRLNLRLVYRLLFVLVAEARDGLLMPGAEYSQARETYKKYFSLEHLKQLASGQRGGAHADGYENLKVLWARLRDGEKALAIPALNGFLFTPTQLDECTLSNGALYGALRALCFVEDKGARRAVNFQLDSQELGSVYESLLEMSPRLDLDATTFTLETLAGNERKTTGSYYTPAGLVKSLLDSALEPVIEARLQLARELANREMGNRGGDIYDRKFLSRPDSVAGSDEAGREVLPADEKFSKRGNVRHDVINTASGKFNSGQHRRGLGTRGNEGVHPVSADSSGQPEGTGNSSPAQFASGVDNTTTHSVASRKGNRNRQDDSLPDWVFAAQDEWRRSGEIASGEKGCSPSPHLPNSLPPGVATRYSLLAEKALLSLKICDPACGSGAFLTAAARRIARELALIRCNGDEPPRAEIQRALRDVIARCIYGVDLNPMAVELCKIALWMESLDPSRPLTFLDAHIREGNALLGVTPELLEDGIPDDAFAPLEGDDKKVCSELRKRNRTERAGQSTLGLFEDDDWQIKLGELQREYVRMDAQGDHDLDALHRKAQNYEQWRQSAPRMFTHGLADAWCAAFVWRKVKDSDPKYLPPITHEVLEKLRATPFSASTPTREEIARLAAQYQWFHWHLEFPAVFAETKPNPVGAQHAAPLQNGQNGQNAGGFDIVLGNPPWERVKLQEKEWFAARVPEIANAPNANARKNLITQLLQNEPEIHAAFLEARRQAEGESHFARKSERFPLCGVGDVNTYALFAELNRSLINAHGRVGCIVPSGIATDDTTKHFFADLTQTGTLVSLFDFENRLGIFPGVHRSFKFCLLTLSGADSPMNAAQFVFFAHRAEETDDAGRRFSLSGADIALLNPNTRTCPIFRSARDAELTKAIYRRVPVLLDENDDNGNAWGISFLRMLDMSNDSELFRTAEELRESGASARGNVWQSEDGSTLLPLYEAKMLHHFDHRWATYESTQNGEVATRDVAPEEKQNPDFVVQPRYWVEESHVEEKLREKWDKKWLLGFRNITNTTNERTFIGSIIPISAVGHSAPLIFTEESAEQSSCLVANLTAFAFDYIARQKVGGTNMTFGFIKQFPVLAPSVYDAEYSWTGGAVLSAWISSRVLELVFTSHDVEPFARDLEYSGAPFAWDESRRHHLRCELDAAFFHLYGLSRDAAEYVLNTFPIVRRKDEKEFGEYRTAQVILEMYDAMA